MPDFAMANLQNPQQVTGYDRLLNLLKQRKQYDLSDAIAAMVEGDRLNPDISERLQQINRLKGWLDEFRPLPVSVVVELKKLYDVRFTYNSNAIEGNTLTQSETELVLETGITIGGKTLREHLEVVGHKDAIDYIEELAQQATRIGEWEIRQIHFLIARATDPEDAGQYRQLDVKAAGTEYRYPPHYLLSELMAEFVEWLNSVDAGQLHPVVYAMDAHTRFVSIHPFRDGNGRTGRLLMNLMLLRLGYPIVVIQNRDRAKYIDGLVSAQQRQNQDAFLELVTESVKNSLVEILSVVVTAGEICSRNSTFYDEMVEFLSEHSVED
jgi:Fic family protein